MLKKYAKPTLFIAFLMFGQFLFAFESDIWQQYEDNRTHFDAKVEGLQLHRELSQSSPVVKDQAVRIGPILYDDVHVKVTMPGLVEVINPAKITGEDFGSIDLLTYENFKVLPSKISLPMEKGQKFQLLQEGLDQGSCLVKINGHVLWADGLGDPFKIVSEPQTSRWIHVVDEKGQARGWLLADQAGMEFH